MITLQLNDAEVGILKCALGFYESHCRERLNRPGAFATDQAVWSREIRDANRVFDRLVQGVQTA